MEFLPWDSLQTSPAQEGVCIFAARMFCNLFPFPIWKGFCTFPHQKGALMADGVQGE